MTRLSTAQIYDDLRRRLTYGVFEPGEKLKPADLQAGYGCSANSVREVLLLLSKDGLVEFALQKGFRVPTPTLERFHDIALFRIVLEQEGATRSIRSGDLAWEARLSAAHHQLSHIETKIVRSSELDPNKEIWSNAEEAFHQTLIAACGLPMLIETYAQVYLQFRQQMIGLERHFEADYFQSIIVEHQAILDAALARDEAACREAIYLHQERNLLPDKRTPRTTTPKLLPESA